MEFGIFSHDERHYTVPADAWDEDLKEIVAADRLGYAEAWITEHFGAPRPGLHPYANLFICKAAAVTKRIRLAPGIRVLPLYHPVHVATEAAVCDQLTHGRYMAGFGAGGERGDPAKDLGMGDGGERHERMYEAIDLIQRCWTEPQPFDYDGRFWQCTNVKINPRPLQQPMPTALACSRSDSTLQFAGENGLMPLFGFYEPPSAFREMAEMFLAAGEAVGRLPRRADIRVPRYVHISDSVKKARAEVRDTLTPLLERRKRDFPWQFRRLVPPGGTLEDVTFDYLLEAGSIFVGDPDHVREGLQRAYAESGGFGVLLLMVGKDAGTRQQRTRSLRLFMEHVAPRLADLEPDPRVVGALK
jgi:alkanesulfonate monooxygenase SsuD/methylene tetrahydromethanopterin reductase-like flavin-dependent oxidoreductase (luciferase family)